MGSAATSISKDMRLGIDGDVGQVTAPQSQIANPFGLAIGIGDRTRGSNVDVTYGTVMYNDLAQVNALVTDILGQQDRALQSINQLGADFISQVSTAAGEIKEPLTRFIPWVAAGILLFIFYKLK